jgi:hypothetical protein
VREVDAPETPAEVATARQLADAAWSAFLQTPAWHALRREFEAFRTKAINTTGKLGLSPSDRAVLAGQLQTYEFFLSAPAQALQRLRMRHDHQKPLGTDASTAQVDAE